MPAIFVAMEAAVQNGTLRADDIEIRPGEFLALAGGRPLDLTVRELELLTALVQRSGRIVSREELYRVVWGESYRKADRSVDVYVGKLRHKLDQVPLRARSRRVLILFTSFSQGGDSPVTD